MADKWSVHHQWMRMRSEKIVSHSPWGENDQDSEWFFQHFTTTCSSRAPYASRKGIDSQSKMMIMLSYIIIIITNILLWSKISCGLASRALPYLGASRSLLQSAKTQWCRGSHQGLHLAYSFSSSVSKGVDLQSNLFISLRMRTKAADFVTNHNTDNGRSHSQGVRAVYKVSPGKSPVSRCIRFRWRL